jgi:hypothetical protein
MHVCPPEELNFAPGSFSTPEIEEEQKMSPHHRTSAARVSTTSSFEFFDLFLTTIEDENFTAEIDVKIVRPLVQGDFLDELQITGEEKNRWNF